MRRADREVRDPGEIRRVIESCTCCRLGFWDGREVYIVPLNFGYEERGNARTFYFHGAREGRKAALISGGCGVGFELDTDYRLHTADTACGHSAGFSSVVGTGRVRPVTEPEEKRSALRLLMRHAAGNGDWAFSEDSLAGVLVFRLDVEQISCKEHV